MQHRLGLRIFTSLMLGILTVGLLFAPAIRGHADAVLNSPQVITVTGKVLLDGVPEAGVVVELLAIGIEGGRGIAATSTTDSLGNYRLTTVAGCDPSIAAIYLVEPRKSVFEFSPHNSVISCSGESISVIQNFAMIRPPIIIQGGYTPFTVPQSGCPQFRLDGSSYNPGACGEVEFASLLAALRFAGWDVHTVMMESSILGTPSLAAQTSALKRGIQALKAATGARTVIVLAHGIGGIVARRYLESISSNSDTDVSHLFTFGSPHLGNPVESTADIWLDELLPSFLDRKAHVPAPLIPALITRIKSTVADKVNFLCTSRMFTFSLGLFGSFNVPGLGQAALCETSPSGMANFNLSFRLPPNAFVHYHLIHGLNVKSPTWGFVNSLGQAMSEALPGSDDGLVQTRNATAFNINGPYDRLITHDPHMLATSASTRWYLNTNGDFDSAFVACIRPMFITRTISNPTCGTVSLAQNAALTAAMADADEAISAKISRVEGVAVSQKTALRSAVLTDTTVMITQPVQLVEPGAATFLASWITGTVSLTVIDPNGGVISPTVADANVQYLSEGTRASYAFSTTQPGLYTMQLQATAMPTSSVAVNYFAAMESEYALTTARNRNWLPPGGAITITALFTGPTEIQSPLVKAYVHGSNNLSETVLLDNLGNGNYRSVYTAGSTPGYIEMEIVATGKVNGVGIERSDTLAFTVYPDSFRPNGIYSETVGPRGLTIDVGISVTQNVTGSFRVTGILVDGDGKQVGSVTSMAVAPAAALTSTKANGAMLNLSVLHVPLFFKGSDLYNAGRNGPFILRRLLVIDEREHALVSADEANVFTTSAINIEQFAHSINLPLVVR